MKKIKSQKLKTNDTENNTKTIISDEIHEEENFSFNSEKYNNLSSKEKEQIFNLNFLYSKKNNTENISLKLIQEDLIIKKHQYSKGKKFIYNYRKKKFTNKNF